MKRKLTFTIASIGLCSWFLYFQNNHIVTTEHTLTSDKVPSAFDGMTIVHISDLHNKAFKKDQSTLVAKIKAADPDVVFITGDIVDARRYHAEPSLTLVRELVSFVPVYYVTGNHEARSGKFDALETDLIASGVTVLRNETEVLSKGDENILITGIDDPTFHPDYPNIDDTMIMTDGIETALDDYQALDDFHLLLSHRPELLPLYTAHDFDVVFSGHAHGGQIILPFIGGLIAPSQGFFPAYTEGLHTVDNTTMAVSRGLGNSLFPFRIFNRPEIVVLTLEKTISEANH